MSDKNENTTMDRDSKLHDIYLPERFTVRVISHILANYLDNQHFFKPPLYLAIQGKAGEGKTTQVLATCKEKKIHVYYLSASELSGVYESESKSRLAKVYEQALSLRKKGKIICILIDDFHLGNSSIEKHRGKTINAELLIGYMMNLTEKSPDERIPIILTGNDFKDTYQPLLRDGRSDIFSWEPNFEEKVKIVESIFDPILIEKEKKKIKSFVKKYSKKSISFFAQLNGDLRRSVLSQVIKSYTTIDFKTISSINESLKLHQITISELYQLARKRIKNRVEAGL